MVSLRPRTNPFVIAAAVYLTAGLAALLVLVAVAAGLVDALPRLRWVTVHLVTIGGLTQAVFGFLPALARGDCSATDASTTGRQAQWLLLNVGYPLVLLGMTAGAPATTLVGTTGVLLALTLLLVTVFRTSPASPLTARYHRTAPWFLVVGIAAAAGLLSNVYGPGGYFGLLEAHVHANVWGFVGLVVAGTLLTLLPAVLGTPLRYPRLPPVSFWGLTLGALGLVVGPPLAWPELTVAGLLTYVAGTGALLASVVGTIRASDWQQPRRATLVVGAYFWLLAPVPVAPFVLLAPNTVPVGAIEQAAITGLVFGWLLQLAMAFLPALALSTRGGAADTLVEGAAAVAVWYRPSWVQVATINVGVALLWLRAVPQLSGSLTGLTGAGYALVALAWLVFVRALWRSLGIAANGRPDRVDAARDSP